MENRRNISVLILGAQLNTMNMGVSALAVGIVNAVYSKYPDAEIYFLEYGSERKTYRFNIGQKSVSIGVKNIRFSKKFYLKNNIAYLLGFSYLLKLLPFSCLRQRIICKNEYLRAISEADIVAAISGGDSFSDIYGMRRFMYVSMPQLLVQSINKPITLLPQTLGPFNRKLTKFIAKCILKDAALVYSRDHESLREIQSITNEYDEKKYRFCYDVAFNLEPVKPENIDLDGLDRTKIESLVGFNVSGLLYMGGYTRKNMFGLNIDYPAFVKEVIDYMIQERGASILLVPHVYGTDSHAESDAIVCKKVYRSMKGKYDSNIYMVRGVYNQSELKYIIGLCDFFIGSRMHACIAAISQNIPAVPIAYSKKFKGIMDTVEMGYYVADPKNMRGNEILFLIGRAYDHRFKIKKKLEAKMPEVKKRVENLFWEIKEELDKQGKK